MKRAALTEAGLLEKVVDLAAEKLAEKALATLPPERIEEMEQRAIASRIGQLTLEQAARHLQCANLRQLTDFCREQNIPLRHFGAKKRFILIGDIEAAQARARLAVAAAETTTGTIIATTAHQERKAA